MSGRRDTTAADRRSFLSERMVGKMTCRRGAERVLLAGIGCMWWLYRRQLLKSEEQLQINPDDNPLKSTMSANA